MSPCDHMGGNYAAELQKNTVYRDRRRAIADRIAVGTVVIWGAGDGRGYQDVGSFRQNSDFFYLTGVELPNAMLALRPADAYEALFLPPRNPNIERWTGPKWGPDDEAATALGFDRVLSTEPGERVAEGRLRPIPGFEDRLQRWLAEGGAVLWTPYPSVATTVEMPPIHRRIARLRDRTPSFEVRDLTQHLTAMRLVKDRGEVELVRNAVLITAEAQRHAGRTIRPGVREGIVDGVVYAAIRERGAEGVAFPSIIGSGINATTLHYEQNSGVCGDGELVVVDIGARYGYYCGDLTRTFPVNGRFSDRQRAVYEVVREAHDRVADEIRPGVTLSELRKTAYRVIEESDLRDARGECLGQYFIHGLGHFLGIDAHDPGNDEIRLERGMVITNEPGVYIPDEALGIRIEDDYLVTDDGNENLSAELPTAPEAIEALMRVE
jgi:Xaa-Pro aminopeptidase